MDAPLGNAVGNALEIVECLEVLKGRGPADLIEISLELAARMLVLGGITADTADARRRVARSIESGDGLERFGQIIEAQGGDRHVVDDYQRLPHVKECRRVTASRAGFLARLDAELIGRASVALGAGRNRVEDPVDFAVGIVVKAKPGDRLAQGDPILELHYRDNQTLDAALALVSPAIGIEDQRPAPRPLLLGEVS
jgi:thymidine phosphorylase